MAARRGADDVRDTTAPAVPPERVAAVRGFNRFVTRHAGALDEGHLGTRLSLAEARIVYELARREAPTATEIGRALGLDAGYLSRLLRSLEERRLVGRAPAADDRRRSHLRLTARGRAVFARLDARANDAAAALLAPLDDAAQRRLVGAMRTVEGLLGGPAGDPAAAPAAPVVLRRHRPGDLGWVVQRHGEVYAREYGWDERFEGLVARVVADFVAGFDPARERCWIAERGGERVGSIFLVRHPERDGVARLRLLLVERSARGLGLGRRLVDECTRFARSVGYHTITLWTNSVLVSARRIYEAAGYRLVHEAPHADFGVGLVGQTWELAL